MYIKPATMESVWRFLKKLKTELPYDPGIPLLGIYPKDIKSALNGDTCTPMFITALTIHSSQAMESSEVSISYRMDKENVVYIYTMVYYSVIKKNKIMSFAGNRWN
jgi:hypothetical protein